MIVLKCVNSSITRHSNEILAKYSRNNNDEYKKNNKNIKKNKLKIGIVSFYTENIADYVVYSFAVNQAYVEYNNYAFKVFDPTMMTYYMSDPKYCQIMAQFKLLLNNL